MIKHFQQTPLLCCNLISSLRRTVMFLHESPQTVSDRSVTVWGSEGTEEKGKRGGGQVEVGQTSLSPSLITNVSSWNSTFFFQPGSQLFFYVCPLSPCCDRRLRWLSSAPGADTTVCCLLFVDYYWFSLILHLKINSQSRRKIGPVYTYSNILLCNREGRRFGSTAMMAAANYKESS